MPLNSVPPTTSPDALAAKRAAADGKVTVDVGFWGGAVPDNLGRLRAAARGRGVRVQVLPARLRRPRVPAARPRPAAGGDDRDRRVRRPADRARRRPRDDRPPRRPRRPPLRRLPRLSTRRVGDPRRRDRHRRRPRDRLPLPHRARLGRRHRGHARLRRLVRGPRHRRDLPALPHPDRRGRAGRPHRVQVLPAGALERQRRPPVARRRAPRDRHRGVGPLPQHPRPQVRRRRRLRRLPGVGSPRCSSASRWSGPRPTVAASSSPASSAGWPPAPRDCSD